MIAPLSQAFTKLERQREAVLAQIGTFPPPTLALRPDPSAWSVLHVLDHLVKVEIASIAGVRAALPNGHPVTVHNMLKTWIVHAVMLSPMRIKRPANATTVIPTAPVSLSALAAQWAATRSDLHDLLASIRPDQLRAGLFQHPVSGWMTPNQMMTFLSAHLRHHRYQLDRLGKAWHVHGVEQIAAED